MANPAAQAVFRKIIVHNKLMSEADVDALLASTPDPENAIKKMVAKSIVSVDVCHKLMALYAAQLKKLESGGAAPAAAAPARPAPSPSGGQNFGSSGAPADSIPLEPAPAKPVITPKVATTPAATSAAAPAAARPAAVGAPKAVAHGAMFNTGEGVVDIPEPPKPTREPKISDDGFPIIEPLGDSGVQWMHAVLRSARSFNASDLHLKSGEIPVIRVGGALRTMGSERYNQAAVEGSLLSLLPEDKLQHFRETNDIDFCYDGGLELGRFRTNYMRQHRGVDGVFRLLPSRPPSFDELGLPEVVMKCCDFRQGICLITGPKGCGKTTTLAALVDLINSRRQEHIITVEDPIEFVHPCKKGHVNQREVGNHTKTFSNALRAALREAPDVIMVGEMRDLETTELAITAAETGHLVFATLHTPDAVRTIGRVLDAFPAAKQEQVRATFSESLRVIVSQLLVPRADGKGSVMATEVLVNTGAIANMIRDNRAFQLRGMIQTGKKQGMVLMDESLIQLAKAKKITKEDAIGRAENVGYVTREIGA